MTESNSMVTFLPRSQNALRGVCIKNFAGLRFLLKEQSGKNLFISEHTEHIRHG